MKLTDFFVSDRQMTDTAKVSVDTPKNSIIQRQIHTLVSGQTLQGEVLSKNGSEVQIRVSDDFILQAKLEQQMNLDIGKIMSFEVKNNGKTLLLMPLFTNMATDANVLKALDMASLPVNESTVTMTQKLMEAGLPIDKNSLQQVYREMNQFRDTEIMDIVNLHKLQMDVNDKNVTQMVSYRNLSHQMVTGLNNVLDAVPKLMSRMMEEGNREGAMKLYQQIVSLVQDNSQGLEIPKFSMGDGVVNGEFVAVTSAKVSGDIISMKKPEEVTLKNPDNIIPGTENATQNSGESVLETTVDAGKTVAHTEVSLLSGDISGKEEIAKSLNPLLQLLKEQWTITPEEVADPLNVNKLYNRLNRQLKGLEQALEGMGERNSTAFRAVNNLSQNLDFMQQINQAYTYVQLPLRLQQGEAHGDLYVYTNKKHLATKDGQISALLHLDMEHLGPVDVYVSMAQQKVNTKFYLKDDEMLDFIMEHIDILTQRLKKRGYQCNCEMLVHKQKDGQEDSIQKLLQAEKQVPLAEYSFDVRT